MHRKSAPRWGIWSALVVLALAGRATAAPPLPEQLLPASTTEFVGISNVNRLAAEWQQTSFAHMLRDPLLKPFLDEFCKQSKGANHLLDAIGADFELVKAATGGEFGWAVVLVSPTQVAHVLTLDTVGKTPQAEALLTDISQKLSKMGGRGDKRALGNDMFAVVVKLPNGREIIYGIKDTLLVITDHLPTLQGIVERWTGQATDTLANLPAFQHVRRKTKMQDGEQELIRFYTEPITRSDAKMIYNPDLKKGKGDNRTQALRKEGIDGIKGVGAAITFRQNGADVIIRAAAYAPPPFRAALRMAKLPNEAPVTPDPWVPAELSGYATYSFDMLNAYDCFGSLFDRLADEPPGSFEEIMKRCAEDADGPKVNVRSQIIAQLQNRLTLINDATRPIQERSERFLIAVPVRDANAEAILKQAIRNCFANDRRIKSREFQGMEVWEYFAKKRKSKSDKNPAVTLPGMCFTVAKGHLFLSTHATLLEQVLTDTGAKLAQAEDYKRFMGEMARLGMGPSNSRSFIRLDVGTEATYEMLRANKLDSAQSIYGAMLQGLLKFDDNGQKKLKADGSTLPPHSQIVKYLGVAGAYSSTDEDGWRVVAAVFKK